MSRRYSSEEWDELIEEINSYADEVTQELRDIGIQVNSYLRTNGWEHAEVVIDFFSTSSDFNIVVDGSNNYTFNYPNLAEVGETNSVEFESLDNLIDYIEEHYT